MWTEATTESTKHQKVEATNFVEIYEVKKKFEKVIVNFLSTEIEWLPINTVSLKGEENQNMTKFLETLEDEDDVQNVYTCLLYTSPSPRDSMTSRMPSSA